MSKWCTTVILFATVVSASAAQAVVIDIDPAAYGGSWQIVGVTGARTGAESVDLAAGTHQMEISGFDSFLFDVAANGMVMSQNSAAAVGAGSALTFNTTVIEVDPAAFAGDWWLVGVLPTASGFQSATVVPALTYQVRVAGSGAAAINFDVAANGAVASQNTAAAIGAGNRLTFNTTGIEVDPAAYGGDWWLVGVLASTSGFQSATVVPALTYQVRVAGSGAAAINFDVTATGSVTSQDAAAAQGSGNRLTFNTTQIEVDPGVYAGDWWLVGVLPPTSGFENATVVPALRYQVRVAGSGAAAINFDVAANGTIASQNAGAAVGSGNRLTFNTTLIQIDPSAYTGGWWLVGVLPQTSGFESVIVVPALAYQIRIAGTGIGAFNFSVAANGDVSSSNGSAAAGSGNLLTFQTTVIQVDPSSYGGTWTIFGVVDGQTGLQTVVVVPGVSYQLQAGIDAVSFSVAEPCAVSPSQVTLAATVFEISCGALDSDGDGVPDASDNCPATPNPDQVDQDLDGAGDACDSDLDGDGVENAIDNCPNVENAGQDDFDGDLVGDACDTDADGDAVPDLADNCLFVPNTDQADNDGDLIGDACDMDDDNDSFDDDVDNCPLDANADQSDADGNGEGDACDGDIDGDGVANEDDLCPLSAMSEPTNADGCTGAQFIALSCVQENFVQHGKYVSCVAHAAKEAAEQGLISNQDKARFVRNAAKSKN